MPPRGEVGVVRGVAVITGMIVGDVGAGGEGCETVAGALARL